MNHYRKKRRDLPWRKTDNPYHIMVAEIMLQQTQVQRVIPFYQKFIQTFPTISDLASASRSEVLRQWSGLGYNSRAIRLQESARIIQSSFGGVVPDDPVVLLKLPGIGFYTSGAIAAFAFDRPAVFFDTNIRRVVIAGLRLPPDISKTALLDTLRILQPKTSSREWYNALMDYGAMKLTASETNIPPLSKQSSFRGSNREVRGSLMKILLAKKRISMRELTVLFPEKDCITIVRKMVDDGLPIVLSKGRIMLTGEEKTLKK